MHAYIYVFAKDELRLLPILDFDNFSHCKFDLVNIKDGLVGMVYKGNCRDSLVDMYSFDTESDIGVWSKMYAIGHLNLRNKYSKLSKCFNCGGEILIVDRGHLCFYDPETTEIKFIRSSQYVLRSCYSYTPSLVSVEGMESMMVLPFQEMELKNLAKGFSNLVESSGIPMSDSSSSSDSGSDSDSSSGTSGSDSDAEPNSDSGTSSDLGTSSESDPDAETD